MSVSELPPDWETKTLGELCDLVRGVTYRKEEARSAPAEGYVPILRATNIGAALNFDGLVFVPKSRVKPDQYLQVGDIVIAASSGSRQVVGKAAPLKVPWVGSFGAFCMTVRPKPGVAPEYVAAFMQSNEYRNRLSSLAAGVNINNLKREHIESQPIPLALEQEAIAAEIEKQFTRLEAGSSLLGRAEKNLQRMRASILNAAFKGTLVPQDASRQAADSMIDDTAPASLMNRLPPSTRKRVEEASLRLADTSPLPIGWVQVPAARVCEAIDNGDTPPAKKMSPDKGDVPFIKVYNLTDSGRLDFSKKPTFIDWGTHRGELGRSQIRPGDVLMNIVGPPLGKVSVVPELYPEWNTNQAVVLFRTLESLDSRLLACWLMSGPVLSRLKATARATAGQFNISLTTCRAVPLRIPPLEEQELIVQELEKRLSIIDETQRELASVRSRSQSLRQSVLSAAFSGRLLREDGGRTEGVSVER